MLVGCGKSPRRFPGAIVGANAALGHRLRDGAFPPPSQTRELDFAVAGGGIAGLAAGRRLEQRHAGDFIILELEQDVGGNAASGRNTTSAYPWGAHYVPLPNEESSEVLQLFEELGITRGRDADGAPVYREEYVCADPMERLFDAGRWEDGLLPQIGISERDREQYDRFFARMESFRAMRGRDNRPAFSIPLDLSSRDPELLTLDKVTMGAWMTSQGWDSAPLRWHVDYSCRDDYGAGIDHVSAWAGVHYFAARRGRAANADRDAVVTWPEGNGWLVQQLAHPLRDRIHGGSVVFRVEQHGDGVEVDYFKVADRQTVRLRTRGIVCAMPRFVAQRVIGGLDAVEALEYSPWMVANITLDELPAGRGTALAWDNVARGSSSLGYVVATHQSLLPVQHATVITHYWPLDSAAPRDERQRALTRTHAEWCNLIVDDLTSMHAGIERHIRNIDVWLWGHGMIRPVPGFIWGETREHMQQPLGRIAFAHSDLSGISIFEEAYTRGMHAADLLLDELSS